MKLNSRPYQQGSPNREIPRHAIHGWGRPWIILSVLAVFCLGVWGCENQEASSVVGTKPIQGPLDSRTSNLPSASTTSSEPTGSRSPRKIVAFGDSLTAGLGVSTDEAYPAQLERHLQQAGFDYTVINAGVSGETSAGGLRRVNWILKSRPSIVILELGANDGLRGQPVQQTYENLHGIMTQLQNQGVQVILAGMKIPLNYGEDYTAEFSGMYERLAQEMKVPFIPFFLEGVAARPELNQGDGLHPTGKGYEIVVQNVWKILAPMLEHALPSKT